MMSGDLLSTLVRKLTGRSYANLSFSQLRYAWQKGGMNYLRGCVWGLLRLRGSRGLMLGRAVRFISPGSLSYGRGVSFGDGCYLDCSADRGVGIGDRMGSGKGSCSRSMVPVDSPWRKVKCAPNVLASARIAWFCAPVVMRRLR